MRSNTTHPPPTPQPTPCRLWQGRVAGRGYGQRWCKRTKKNVYVHRWVVETAGKDQFGTPWDPSLFITHLCDNPLCYRFDHLRLGTHADNMADMRAKHRHPGNRKLTEQQVTTIRERHAAGETTQRALAAEYDVSEATVSLIVNRKKWEHLP